jgi:hypothetical protein
MVGASFRVPRRYQAMPHYGVRLRAHDEIPDPVQEGQVQGGHRLGTSRDYRQPGGMRESDFSIPSEHRFGILRPAALFERSHQRQTGLLPARYKKRYLREGS